MKDKTWDDARAAAQLLRIAADLIEDETPFHHEIRNLHASAIAAAGVGSLRVEHKGQETYAAQTLMPESTFRRKLRNILEWEKEDIDKACQEVRQGKDRPCPEST